ncbi:MAG: tetratricopeptide repeat protein [Acidobacteriota bacterium]|nr:tetratricopeptide repeat protein [Acidobacteriota bacterium]
MTRLAQVAVPALFLLSIHATLGQQASLAPPTQRPVTSTEEAVQPPPMTPRQAAEMRADILVARKEFAAAANAYEKILATDRKNAVLLNKIGMAYQQLGDDGKAEGYYKRAWKADKHYASAMNNLGTVEYGKRHYKNAIQYYSRALAVGSDLATIYSNLGYAYCGRKDYPRATVAFQKALAIDPHIFERRGEFGSIFLQRSAPDPGTVYYLMAKSYAKLNDAKESAHYLKLARDAGYKDLRAAEKDASFKGVIASPLIQEVLRTPAPFGLGKRPPAQD